MGQYYNPIILKTNWKTAKQPVLASLKCYDYDNGAKLMEHSWVGNSFVSAMCWLLSREDYFGHAFVWCGDYADKVKTNNGEHDLYSDAGQFIYKDYYGEEDGKSKEYEELKESIPPYNELRPRALGGYIVNLTKKEYVKIPDLNEEHWEVHPLPLLTCNSNGRGGGDYHGTDIEKVGVWAFDRIGVVNEIFYFKKLGFKEYKVNFSEEW